jgi:hypothetical protein
MGSNGKFGYFPLFKRTTKTVADCPSLLGSCLASRTIAAGSKGYNDISMMEVQHYLGDLRSSIVQIRILTC